MADPAVSNGADGELSQTTVGAGSAARFRVEFTPTSADGRFGIFQLYVRGVPLGDGTTTALYPHVVDLQRLSALIDRPGVRAPERLVLGDTFDHIDLDLEITDVDVVLTFATRPEWGAPPPWASEPGAWTQLGVARAEVISVWRQAEAEFQRVMQRA